MTRARRAIRHRSPRTWTALLVGTTAACLALVLVAGCGGGSDGAADGTTTGSSTSSGQTSFADCMRAQGVDVPDQTGGNQGTSGQPPAGIDSADLQKGIQACGQYLQGGGGPPGASGSGSPGGGQEVAQCLRDQGITVPEPQAGEAPGSGGPSFDAQDPEVQAAVEKCRSAGQGN